MPNTIHLAWFEVPVIKMSRAIAFYEKVFDITIKPVTFGGLEMGWFPPSEEVGAATGTLIKQESYIPSETSTLLYFSTEEITIELQRVEVAGGKIIQPKTEIGEGHGFMAVFLDTEGNRVALHSNK